MSEKKHELSKPFHNFLTRFALWAFAAFAFLFGVKFIYEGRMNGYEGFSLVMLIIVNVLLIGLGIFIVKVRFDLVAFRAKAPKELVIACIAGAVLCLANYWVQDIAGDDYNQRLIPTAFILALWAFGLYRYYHDRMAYFTN